MDVGAIDPLTNRLVKPQTRNTCWPVSMYTNYINPIYNWWNGCCKEDNNSDEVNVHFPFMKPFHLCYTNDMSAS